LRGNTRGDQRCESGIVRFAQIMTVQIFELLDVEARGRAAHASDVEQLDRARDRDEFLVSMAPAQAQQIVEHGFGQHPHVVAIGVHAQRAVALRKLGTIRAVNQRDMGVYRYVPIHRIHDGKLAEGVVEMIVAANDVGDAHVMVVNHHRQHIGGRAVGAQQDHVVQLCILDDDAALHRILDHGFACLWGLDADHIGRAFGRFLRRAIAPAAIIAHRLLGCPLLFAQRGQFLGRGIAFIRMATVEQLLRDLRMARCAGELEHRFFVSAQPKPVQTVENRGDCFVRRAGAVGILDPQQEAAAMVAREQPVEERRARATDVQEASRRRREPRNDLLLISGCAHPDIPRHLLF
jgi:hypothetical protein